MKKLAEIGSITSVSLPNYAVNAVPAKVDTGADTSSIWASRIVEKDGNLRFRLFDDFSPYYTGKDISVDDYSLISVKNSFGQSQLRYRVSMPIVVEGRQISATFTLANRSSNRFPILIGRRTLQGKFVVNVSKTPKQKTKEVLVLVDKHINSVDRFFANIEQNTDKAINFTVRTYDDIEVTVANSARKVVVTDIKKDINKFNLVYLKNVSKKNYSMAAIIHEHARKNRVPCIDEALSTLPAFNKLHQYYKLSAEGIKIPKTFYASPEKMPSKFETIKKAVGVPFILKDGEGEKGKNNYLIKTRKQFVQVATKAQEDSIRMLAQRYIANTGDFRLLVLGDNVELIINRVGKGKTHLNNTSAGGIANLMPASAVPAKIQAQAIRAAAMLKLTIAGVDMVQDKNNKSWYCLEVNNSPQIASGASVADKEAALTVFLNKITGIKPEES